MDITSEYSMGKIKSKANKGVEKVSILLVLSSESTKRAVYIQTGSKYPAWSESHHETMLKHRY